MEAVIQVKGLKKHYGETKAVDGIDFQVERGELFGFLGVNGAGKSTSIRMLCTLSKPTEGEIEICGCLAGRDDRDIRRKIGVVWQDNCLDERLTLRENLYIRASLYGQGGRKLKESIDRAGERLSLSGFWDRPYGKLSGGQKRRGEIGAALVNTPEILFLDEPTTGLDPAARQSVWECLDLLRREEKVTVFLTTHYMEEAARAGHIAVMDSGRIREFGTPFGLKEKFASDRLKLSPKEGCREELRRIAEKYCPGKCVWMGDFYLASVPDSLSALPVLEEAGDLLRGFELVQGSLDDVFLNITGKRLEESR